MEMAFLTPVGRQLSKMLLLGDSYYRDVEKGTKSVFLSLISEIWRQKIAKDQLWKVRSSILLTIAILTLPRPSVSRLGCESSLCTPLPFRRRCAYIL